MHNLLKRSLILFLLLAIMISFGGYSSVSAYAENTVITKVLTTISSTPVALMDPALISASVSTPGCYIASAAWFDANGNMAVGAFNIETYRLQIYVVAMDGYVIDSGAACYLNNSAVTAIPDGTGKGITLVREYTAAAWAPTIYKQPGAETVNEGNWASFVVSGTYIRDYQWVLLNPTETEFVLVSNLQSRFPNMTSNGDGTSKLFLYNIPYELNGWKVACNFIGAGNNNSVLSQGAVLTVIPDPSRTVSATPEPTSAAADASAASQTSSAADGAAVSSDAQTTGAANTAPIADDSTPDEEDLVELPHEHSFSESWSFDREAHWHECPEDGERAEEARHEFEWTETEAPTVRKTGLEEGTCTICGYQTTREVPMLELPEAGTMLKLLSLLAPLDLVLILLHPLLFRKQRRRAHRRHAREKARAKAARAGR